MLQDAATTFARVAELVDALDLGSSGVTCESSSLSSRTIIIVGAQTPTMRLIPVLEVKECK